MANDFENGVWRTVGGKRIFIRDGEDLASAMKKSGKFKSNVKAKEKSSESEQQKKDSSNQYKDLYDKEDYDKIISHLSDQEKQELQDTRDSLMYYPKGSEKYKKTYQKGLDLERKAAERYIEKEVAKSSEGAMKEMRTSEVKSQQVDIEKASGLKVEKAFETDLYGNGKEDRFLLEDGRYVAHTTERFGKKVDEWSVNEVGSNGKSERFESFKEARDYLKGGSESESGKTKASDDYNVRYNDSKERHEMTYKSGAYDDTDYAWARTEDYDTEGEWTIKNPLTKKEETVKGQKAARERLKEINNEIQSGKQIKNNEGVVKYEQSKESSSAYKKAFEDYKKKHPNSKITLNKFIDMSEGK